MEANELTIQLEQRDWERLQKLSERNGEPMESLVKKILAAELADLFNQPSEIPLDSEVRRVYESFVEGRTQTKDHIQNQKTVEKAIGEPELNIS